MPRRTLIAVSICLMIINVAPLSAVPNGCTQGCARSLVIDSAKCLLESVLCGPLEPECFAICGAGALASYFGCVSNCNSGGYIVATSSRLLNYNLGEVVPIAAGRWVGDGFAAGQGSVTQASFFLMDLDSIPEGGFPSNTPLDAMPWSALGQGTFDGEQFWKISVDMKEHVAEHGFLVRIDFEDEESDTQVGFGFAILQQQGQGPTEIPTLSELSMLVLICGLLLAAWRQIFLQRMRS